MKKKVSIIILVICILMISLLGNKVNAADATLNNSGYLQVTVYGTQRYDYAKQVFDIVNQKRAENGLSQLTYDEVLTSAAMQRAAEITMKFDHTRPDGRSCFSILGKLNGENIAAGKTTPAATMEQWMNSQGHKENILDSDFKSMGVGCFYTGRGYGWYWVQLFSCTNVQKNDTRTNIQNVNVLVGVDFTNFRINCNNGNSELSLGNTYDINATVDYNNITYNINNNITYTSSDPSVAKIENNKIKCLKVGSTTITSKTPSGKTTSMNIKVIPKQLNVLYRTHVQDVGWQGYVKNGAMAGTSGQSKRLEGINIKLENQLYSGNIEYRTHVQNIGWQGFKKNDEMAGTTGRSLRLEAIEIRLTGEMANHYDVYYRVHTQDIGWMNWAKNGESAGSAGYSYRLEGIEIVLVEKGKNPPTRSNTVYSKPFKCSRLSYRTHVQDIGWQNYVTEGVMAGTEGQSKRLEGININIQNVAYSGNIEYSTHVQNIGWQGFVKNGAMAGTSGRSLRLEAIKIRLTGELANHYDIYYRVHAQDVGWMGWAKNGEEAGTAGYSRRLEGINIVLVEKGGKAPGSTSDHFRKK